jgi:hypothetical protein
MQKSTQRWPRGQRFTPAHSLLVGEIDIDPLERNTLVGQRDYRAPDMRTKLWLISFSGAAIAEPAGSCMCIQLHATSTVKTVTASRSPHPSSGSARL